MQNEFDKYKHNQLEAFFLDESFPLGDKKKGRGVQLMPRNFLENWPQLTIFKGDTIEIINLNTRFSMSPP